MAMVRHHATHWLWFEKRGDVGRNVMRERESQEDREKEESRERERKRKEKIEEEQKEEDGKEMK
jgi:hypothetical protein